MITSGLFIRCSKCFTRVLRSQTSRQVAAGTPAFIIGTELVPGATDLATFKSMVDDARHGIN
jgi:hypothetical protein